MSINLVSLPKKYSKHYLQINLQHFQQKANYGAPRFKPKILKTKPLRTPSMLALDNFDFYYGPLFTNKWPSIRLGLLMPNKFAAVVNRFSSSFEVNKNIMESLGTINLIKQIVNNRDPPKEVEIIRKRFDSKLSKLQENKTNNLISTNSSNPIDYDVESRLESGMEFYLPPTHELKHGELEPSDKEMELIEGSEPNIRRIIYDSKFKVTGLESLDADPLITVDDSLIYPRDLQVFIHPPQCIDGFPGPIRDEQNVSGWWLLDGGSILPVLALDLNEDDIVLDMCASPGGKSLLITQTGKFASLVCNDNKLSRLGQLRRALAMYIPAGSEAASRIILKRKDVSSVESWDECGIYDKVLLDAPCTSDRLSANQDDNNIFATDKTTERLDLPQKQTKMLINALRSVRVGGSVVYSTCTLAPTQNELVVENAVVLAQQHYGIKFVERSLKRMEKLLKRTGLYRFSDQQQRGSLVLPYIVSNFGPMFICKLQRII
uniref:NOL1/NOP2/Sun domain family member 4 n=1 Tax=Meloidogyne enterolobii TaxID=390850 RepID=A0A6V7VRJ2_MELEN|nr:unnamed protein product [Meloidogyne enterolobii]